MTHKEEIQNVNDQLSQIMEALVNLTDAFVKASEKRDTTIGHAMPKRHMVAWERKERESLIRRLKEFISKSAIVHERTEQAIIWELNNNTIKELL